MSRAKPKAPKPGRPEELWPTRPLSEIVAEQGITAPQDLDELIGKGAGLWENDQDLDAFLAEIRASRGDAGRALG